MVKTTSQPKIGVDFDNTIVSYDRLIYQVAREQGLIPSGLPPKKTVIKEYLCQNKGADSWTRLQGHIYGACMHRALLFPGVLEFFGNCRRRNLSVYIISHKTRYPVLGVSHDLHQVAREWLGEQGFFDPAKIGLPQDRVFFCETRRGKIACIEKLGLSHFVDDLLELFSEPDFPENVVRILFDPYDTYGHVPGVRKAFSWQQITKIISD